PMTSPRALRRPAPLAGLAALTLLGTAIAQQPVSPADRTDLEGSSYTHYPLGRASCRMQTLHGDLPGGTVLTGHAYRRDAIGVRGRIDGLAVEVQVTASVSNALPGGASTTFANNRGSNPVVVLPRTWVALPATDRPSLDPAPAFELVLPWTTPFTMPPQGGTLCLEVEVFGNQGTLGTNRNVSLYLDAHELYTDGRCEQPGFRFGQGCAAPGSSRDCYANLSLWHRGTHMNLDVALRDAIPDRGNGLARAFVALGLGLGSSAFPTAPQCTLFSSAELVLPLAAAVSSTGSCDDTFVGMPVLPPGFRLWAQAGAIDLGNGNLTLGDVSGIATPPPGLTPVPCARVVDANNVTGTTGTLSLAVPVIRFL
ncbi:MAG: hypothetical protein RL398_1687, partial [Planctomycetota bacterium]